MLSETRPAKVGKWNEPALRVLRERYLMRQGGEVVETPEELCWRIGARIPSGVARDTGCRITRRPGATRLQQIAISCDAHPTAPSPINRRAQQSRPQSGH